MSNRPDWCPADVWEAAVDAGSAERSFLAAAIARAILAERERCTAACDREIELARNFGPHHIPIISSIRYAIRDPQA